MVGLGESYLAAFALALGVDERSVGLLTIVPILFGATMAVTTPGLWRLVGSRQNWVLIFAVLQATSLIAMSLLPLPIMGLFDTRFALFVFASMYWTGGLTAGPSWNAWIGGIVREDDRLPFFSIRAKQAQLWTVMGLVAGGLILDASRRAGHELTAFSVLFFVAGVLRVVSAFFLWIQEDSPRAMVSKALQRDSVMSQAAPPDPGPKVRVDVPGLRRVFLFAIAFFFLTHFSVHVSAPYFSPYMLRSLQLEYAPYMVLIAASFAGRVIFTNFFVKICKRFGVRTLLIVGACAIVPLPVLWVVSSSYWYLLVLQLLSGFAWGAHELGFTLVLLETMGDEQRSKLLAFVGFFNAVGMVGGTIIGAQLIGAGPAAIEQYHLLFWVSSFMRLLPFVFLAPLLNVHVRPRAIFTRILSVRPMGMVLTKVLPTRRRRRRVD